MNNSPYKYISMNGLGAHANTDPQPYDDDPTDELTLDAADARTRAGYPVADVIRSFTVAIQQTGADSAAKTLHYSADLITSGCYNHWQKLVWDYAIDHVGIASPRIFFFLRRAFADLDVAYGKSPEEVFYRDPANQRQMSEVILVVRLCNRKPALKMPRIPPETHTDTWVNSILDKAPDSHAVNSVWKQGLDARILYRAGKEFVHAIANGSTERALFFLKWMLEEESYVRRTHKSFLCGHMRGPAHLADRVRKGVGMYICALTAEIYRDLASKSKIKMNEEFQALMQLYAMPDKRLSTKRRNDILILIVQILCEVPRWSVPSAPVLVADQPTLLRALNHSESFFREVLAFDQPPVDLEKEIKKKKKPVIPGVQNMTAKEKKEAKMKQQIEEMDALVGQLYGI
jgi:hypothetical protein